MLESIFTNLYNYLYGSPSVALAAAFLWGVASVILSPCHLSSIPLVVAVLLGDRNLKAGKAFRLSLVFALGILISLVLIGIITALLGRMLGDLGRHANLVFGVFLVLGGVLLLDVIPLGSLPFQSKFSKLGAKHGTVLLVGILFGLALGPCAFAFMAPVLTLALSLAGSQAVFAIAVVFAYAVGHCLVIAFAGSSVNLVQKILNWNENKKGLLIIKRICAILVVFGGIYLALK